MASAKSLIVKPISAQDANRIIRSLHYSGKIVPNSQLHLGVFLDGKCGGAMSFGPSTDKRNMLGLVSGTLWNEFVELNRMAFADWLPRNGESRCIAYAMRLIKKTYPHLKWVVSFADGTQCGDGTIYRASGFYLIGIKKNINLLKMPNGEIVSTISLNTSLIHGRDGRIGQSIAKENGALPLIGFQLKYIFFLDPSARSRLTVPILPFSEIEKRGAKMYLGKSSVVSADSGTAGIQPARDGANPITTLSS